MYQHILLPTDGSQHSEQVIEHGVALAKRLGARITGLHVIVASNVAAGIGKSLRREDESPGVAREFLSKISAAARRAGVPCECFHVTSGSAAEGIVHTAEKRACDLIIMYSHAPAGLSRIVLGSDTARVLHDCRIPVLVHR
jgi:nucleotide-binding universal stress UspA family protein